MRNIFDQYSQPENKLTHALVTTLNEDNNLLKEFVRWIVGSKHPNYKKLEILEQRLPGDQELLDEGEYEKKGLPDAWIHDGKNWAIIIESKVADTLKTSQLMRHYKTALGRGFENIFLVGIDTEKPKKPMPDGAKCILWSEIYIWFDKRIKHSPWAGRMKEYMEIAENKMVADGYLKEGTLTTFTGFPFDAQTPYNYREAKRLLRLAMDKFRQNSKLIKELSIDPLIPGRPAITGKEETAIWDFLSLKGASKENNFTRFPHFTLAIKHDHIFALVTVPNGIKPQFRKNLVMQGEEGFRSVFEHIHNNLKTIIKKTGASPWVEVVQRHYKTQRSTPAIDAKLAFDLRTAFNLEKGKGAVKYQPLWIKAVFDALSRRKANTQLAVGVIFPYDQCKVTKEEEILDYIVDVWVGCKPLLKTMLNSEK